MARIRKAVFPVAGLGTRFLPATKTVPKEMLPIVDRPLIQYAVDEAIEAGCDTLVFVTNRYKHAVADYFDKAYELEQKLEKAGKLEEALLVLEQGRIFDAAEVFAGGFQLPSDAADTARPGVAEEHGPRRRRPPGHRRRHQRLCRVGGKGPLCLPDHGDRLPRPAELSDRQARHAGAHRLPEAGAW